MVLFQPGKNIIMAKAKLPMLLGHRDDKVPIGEWIDAHETNDGLIGQGKTYFQDIQSARETLYLAKRDKVSGVSIGFHATKFHENEYGGRNIEKAYPFEASIVLFPANKLARIKSVR